ITRIDLVTIYVACTFAICSILTLFFFLFYNIPPTTEIYTLSLHDALPISGGEVVGEPHHRGVRVGRLEQRGQQLAGDAAHRLAEDRKSTRLNSSHQIISYAVFCLKKKNNQQSVSDALVVNNQYLSLGLTMI